MLTTTGVCGLFVLGVLPLRIVSLEDCFERTSQAVLSSPSRPPLLRAQAVRCPRSQNATRTGLGLEAQLDRFSGMNVNPRYFGEDEGVCWCQFGSAQSG